MDDFLITNQQSLLNLSKTKDIYEAYGDGKLTTDFDGKWPAINDTPLSLEVISSNDAFIRYESPILLNNQEKTLVLAYDRTTEETYITGIREAAAPDILSRQITILENGNTIKYNPEETTVEEKTLDDVVYIQGILLQDFRGNMYLSPLVQFEMEKGRVINASVSGEYRTF